MDDGTKWTFQEHKGPLFAPPYEPLPDDVKFWYDGTEMKLKERAEEAATFYARLLQKPCVKDDIFNENFLEDWYETMTVEEKETIKDLTKCDFSEISEHFIRLEEEQKNCTKEEKDLLKREQEKEEEIYGIVTIKLYREDRHTEKIEKFRITPPGIFQGIGDNPKRGKLRKRILPEDVIINCSKGSRVPVPPKGHQWKEVVHNNKVNWLAKWRENIEGKIRYMELSAASMLKGKSDEEKYDTARKLHKHIDQIRAGYRKLWGSPDTADRQFGVALYFIDQLSLRVGNKKRVDQTDTVGCCSLRVEHITLHEELDNEDFVIEFDFCGKHSVSYQYKVTVEKDVFENLQGFVQDKEGTEQVFDKVTPDKLNKHLSEFMDCLTAKVFRTYNSSKMLEKQLHLLTEMDDEVPAKVLTYKMANRAVATLCNHQRTVPKKQMETIQTKIDAKQKEIQSAEKTIETASENDADLEKKVEQLERQLKDLQLIQATGKDANLATSKSYYIDPRITVAWCMKWEVPVEKIYSKSLRDKFAWAITNAEADFVFCTSQSQSSQDALQSET